nr:hypothetical protein [uncultured Cellulosilyticum sp.]
MEFTQMTASELEIVEGGGWKEAACVFFGTVAVAAAVPVAVVNLGAGLALAGGGLACIDAGI